MEADPGRPHQCIGQLCHRKKIRIGSHGHASRIELGLIQNPRQQMKTALAIIERRIHQRLQIVFRIVHIREGSIVQASKDALRLHQSPARENADMLQRNRIPLLRHDAADLHIGITKPQVAEFHRAPQQQILRKPAQAQHRAGKYRAALDKIIHRRNRPIRVDLQALEAKHLFRKVPVDRKARRRNSARPERTAIHTSIGALNALRIALQNLDERHQIVAQRGRLRWLIVRIRRHQRGAMLPSQIHQPAAKLQRRRQRLRQPVAQNHPVHGQINVITAAGGVHLAGNLCAASGRKLLFQIKEQVFKRPVILLRPDLRNIQRIERPDALRGLNLRHNPLASQHQRMRILNLQQRIEEVLLSVPKPLG